MLIQLKFCNMRYYWFDLYGATSVVIPASSYKEAVVRFSTIYGDMLLDQVHLISVTNKK